MMTSKFRGEPVCCEPKIFVGQIPFQTTEHQVIQLFSKYGTIEKCSVISGSDGRPRGFAMVTFRRWAEAELAVENESGTSNLGGSKALTVKFANPPKRGDSPMVGVAPKKLFVGQIPSNVTEDSLRRYFEMYGTITDIHVLSKPGNQPACAFVTYDRWAQAEEALEALNGNVTLEGASKPMNVKFADAKVARSSSSVDSGGLKRSFTSAAEIQYGPNKRALCGRPNSGGVAALGGYNPYPLGYPDMSAMANLASLCYAGMPGIPAGMPFTNMVNMGLAGLGVAGLQGLSGAGGNSMGQASMMGSSPSGLGGMAQTGFGPKGGFGFGLSSPGGGGGAYDGPKAWKLFVGQVPFEASEDDLLPLFGQIGSVLEIAVLRQNGKSRGCAFVTYETRAFAEKAIQILNNKVALPKDPQQRLLRVKFANNNQ